MPELFISNLQCNWFCNTGHAINFTKVQVGMVSAEQLPCDRYCTTTSTEDWRWRALGNPNCNEEKNANPKAETVLHINWFSKPWNTWCHYPNLYSCYWGLFNWIFTIQILLFQTETQMAAVDPDYLPEICVLCFLVMPVAWSHYHISWTISISQMMHILTTFIWNLSYVLIWSLLLLTLDYMINSLVITITQNPMDKIHVTGVT